METIYSSETAIIMLNYYPLEIVQRALNSIINQTHRGTWTLYLGFHNRSEEHKKQIVQFCEGLPVHYVDIDRELIFDVRARDRILQTALTLGDHKFLFFLDDDDEWYPHYLETMISARAPFVTCAKDVYKDETGEINTVYDDFDYGGMGFYFGLWKKRRLPFFVKQVSDKHILREFKFEFPQHPVISKPLYQIRQHSGSLTFKKSLGRNSLAETLLSGICTVVCPKTNYATYQDSLAVAKALNTRVLNPSELRGGGVTEPLIVISPLPVLPGIFGNPHLNRRTSVIVALVDRTPLKLFGNNSTRTRRIVDLLKGVDALLLADPLWVDAYEAVHPHCLPVGIPSLVEEAEIKEKCVRPKQSKEPLLAIPGIWDQSDQLIQRVVGSLHDGFRLTNRLRGSTVCWVPDLSGNGWGSPVLSAFEEAIPCITSPRTSTSRILFGGSDLLVDPTDLWGIVRRICNSAQGAYDGVIGNSLPLFRRCFGLFYWRNHFAAYIKPVLAHKGFAIE